MVYREIVSEVKRLPLHEQLLLVEELLRGMRQTAQPPTRSKRRRIVPFKQLAVRSNRTARCRPTPS